jgi:hypothetical protein
MYNFAWAVLGKGQRDVNSDLTRGKKLCQYPVVVEVVESGKVTLLSLVLSIRVML